MVDAGCVRCIHFRIVELSPILYTAGVHEVVVQHNLDDRARFREEILHVLLTVLTDTRPKADHIRSRVPFMLISPRSIHNLVQ